MATLSIRIDDNSKSMFDRLCNYTGITVSSAITMFVKKCIHENKISVDAEGDPFYSESNQKWLSESIADAEAGKVTAHELVEDK